MPPSDMSLVLLAPLFLALAALAIIVPFLHRRDQRRFRRVPTLMLWRQMQNARGLSLASQTRPQLNLPMLLQMAVLVLIAFALARPLVGANPVKPVHKIYVLDASGSMMTRDGARTRFDAAKARLSELMRADVDPDGPCASLVLAGPVPDLLLARQRVDHDLPASVEIHLLASDGLADWNAVERLVQITRRADETDQLIILTDGTDSGVNKLGLKFPDLPVSILSFGTSVPNASLEARLAPLGDGTDKIRLSGNINFSGGLSLTNLTVDFRSDGAASPLQLASRTIATPRNGTAPNFVAAAAFELELAAVGKGVLSVRVSRDAVPYDDVNRFVIDAKPAQFDILLVGRAHPALLNALRSLEGAAIQQSLVLPQDVSGFRLVVINDAEVDRVPETNTLWIGQARLAGAAKPPALEPGDVTSWRADHPLSRGLFWSGFRLSRADQFAPWPDSDVILAAGDTRLIEARSGKFGREIRLAFDPTREWASRTSFPQFLGNAIEWLGLVQPNRIQPSCTVGMACPVDARWFGKTLLSMPDAQLAGQSATSSSSIQKIDLPAPGAEFKPAHAGLYRLEGDPASRLLAINPQSDGQAADTIDGVVANDFIQREPTLSLWTWLLALAAMVLGLEAWVSVRRRSAPRWLPPSRAFVLALVAAALFRLPAPVLSTIDRSIVVLGAPLAPGGPQLTTGAANVIQPATIVVGDAARVTGDFGEPVVSPGSVVDPNGSGADAIRLAAAMLPAGHNGRIVLGGEIDLSTGEIAELSSRLKSRGIVVDVAAAGKMPIGEVALVEVDAPQAVFAGESFTLTGKIRAANATNAHLKVSLDEETIAEQDVDLVEGDNPVEISIPKARDGDAFYRMEIASASDVIARNNRNGVHVRGRTSPRILILGAGTSGRDLADSLVSHGFSPKVMVPTGAPWLLEDWLAYDAYVFLDVPAIALNTTQQELVADAVSRHGRPLLLFGGPRSFGPGGYLETVLDKLSPLSSRVPKPSPEAAVVFVIDRSGSMAQAVGDADRLQIAKQATLSAMGLLNPQSKVGIIAFDTEARVVAPLQPVTGIGNFRNAMLQMTPGGGTDLFPALGMAFSELRDASSSVKHIIVFTDGLTPPAAFDPLVKEMTEAGISTSVVSIGTSGGDNVLRNIARLGGGAFHATNDFKALPGILSQETMLLSDSAVEERKTSPQWVGERPPFLAGLPAALPDIEGYVLTTGKPDATISLKVATADGGDAPLLASWQYGSGKVLALTTQASGPWTSQWLAMPGYQGLWAEVIPHFLSGGDSTGLTLRTVQGREGVRISATALDNKRNPRSQLKLAASVKSLTSEHSSEKDVSLSVPLRETQPGIYESTALVTLPGDYEIDVVDGDKSTSSIVHIAFAPRLAFDPGAIDGVGALAAATGGRETAWTDVIWQSVRHELSVAPNWIVWALLALAAFAFELLCRYGRFGWAQSAAASRAFQKKV